MNKKEKELLYFLYRMYKKTGTKVFSNSEILQSLPDFTPDDIGELTLNYKNDYFHNIGVQTKLTPSGIAFMENKFKDFIKEIAFWVFGLASLIAAVFGVLEFFN